VEESKAVRASGQRRAQMSQATTYPRPAYYPLKALYRIVAEVVSFLAVAFHFKGSRLLATT
jgi:hypothetical protein